MVALTNATKVVKIVKGTAKLSEDTTVNKDKVYYAQTVMILMRCYSPTLNSPVEKSLIMLFHTIQM